MTKTKKTTPSFDQLSPAQKEAIFRKADRVRADDGVPLNAKDRRLHRQAGLPVGRPRVGQGAKRINISMELGLLKAFDAFARQKGMTRAGLIAESIRTYMAGAA